MEYGQARSTTVAAVASPIRDFNENQGLAITSKWWNKVSSLACSNEHISNKRLQVVYIHALFSF